MSCIEVRDLLPEFALGLLDETGAGDVERHLDACPGCRKEAQELLEGAERLSTIPVQVPPPVALEPTVAALVRGASGGSAAPKPTSPARDPRRRQVSRRSLRVVAAVALAAALTAGGSLTWAIAMHGQVEDLQHRNSRAASRVKLIENLLAHVKAQVATNSVVLDAILASPDKQAGSGAVVVVSIPNAQDLMSMQATLPASAQGPFRVQLQAGTGTISAGALVKTRSGYVLSTDPRFFDQDLSKVTWVVVLDRSGHKLLVGPVHPIEAGPLR